MPEFVPERERAARAGAAADREQEPGPPRQVVRPDEGDGRDEAEPVERHGREGEAAVVGVGVHRRHDFGRRIVEVLADQRVDAPE